MGGADMTNITTGWPDKPGVPLDTPEGNKLKMDAGIPHLPTQLTYDCRAAIGGNGPLAYTWQDKPHRLVYDLCREIERLEGALRNLIEHTLDCEFELDKFHGLGNDAGAGMSSVLCEARAALEGRKE